MFNPVVWLICLGIWGALLTGASLFLAVLFGN